MGALVAGFVVQQALQVTASLLGKAIQDVLSKSKQFKPLLKQLESTVERITPIFKDIESLNEDVHRPAMEIRFLGDLLNKGKNLVKECAGASWWNKSSYAKKLIEYDGSLTRFFQNDVTAQILHGVRRVEKNLAGLQEEFVDFVPPPHVPPPHTWLPLCREFVGFVPPPHVPPPPAMSPPPHVPPPPAMYIDDDEHSLDFLRNSPQFLALLPLLKENRDILKLTLEGLQEKHPDILRRITGHKAEFLQLIYGPVDDDDISKLIEDHKDLFEELTNEPVDGSSDGHLFDKHEQEMPHAINVSLAEQETPHTISVILAEQEAIERLEEMGFDSDLVIEAFLACDGNEELAVNYLLENAGYFED